MTVQIYNPKIALVKRAHHTLEPNFTTKTLQIIATNRDSDVKKIRKKVKKFKSQKRKKLKKVLKNNCNKNHN